MSWVKFKCLPRASLSPTLCLERAHLSTLSHAPCRRGGNGVTYLLLRNSNAIPLKPDLMGSPMSVPFLIVLPFPPIIRGLQNPEVVENLGIWLPGFPCSLQRASGLPFSHPHCSARNGLSDMPSPLQSTSACRACHLRSQAQSSSGLASLA